MQPLEVRGVFKRDIFLIEVEMQSKVINKAGFLILISLFFTNTLLARQEKTPKKPYTPAELRKMDKGKMRPPHGASFQINPMELNKGMYLALIGDEEGRTAQDFVLYDKLPILEAIISEAKKFGSTEEAVGGAKPLTTRFSDKQVPYFVVDVSKVGKLSHFYITLKGQTGGSITIHAGTINRGDTEAKAMLYDILVNVQAMREHAASTIQ